MYKTTVLVAVLEPLVGFQPSTLLTAAVINIDLLCFVANSCRFVSSFSPNFSWCRTLAGHFPSSSSSRTYNHPLLIPLLPSLQRLRSWPYCSTFLFFLFFQTTKREELILLFLKLGGPCVWVSVAVKHLPGCLSVVWAILDGFLSNIWGFLQTFCVGQLILPGWWPPVVVELLLISLPAVVPALLIYCPVLVCPPAAAQLLFHILQLLVAFVL